MSATKMDEWMNSFLQGFVHSYWYHFQALVSVWNEMIMRLPGGKIIRREKISVSSTRCSLRKEDMQIPLDFFIADCSYSAQHTAADCVPTQPFAP